MLKNLGSRGIAVHGRSFHPPPPPRHEPPHGTEKDDAQAQDKRPERQSESQEYGGHTPVPERLLDK